MCTKQSHSNQSSAVFNETQATPLAMSGEAFPDDKTREEGVNSLPIQHRYSRGLIKSALAAGVDFASGRAILADGWSLMHRHGSCSNKTSFH